MKTFALILKQKSGLLTELQSDTIYGHFCWRLKESLGEDRLKEFIEYYKNDKPIFLLSNGLIKVKDQIRFPRPFIFDEQLSKETKYDKVLNFVVNKSNKERNYLTLNELNNFLKSGKVIIEEEMLGESEEKKIYKNKKPLILESLRVSVQIDRSTYSSMQGRLFSYKPIYSREDVFYVILIKVLNSDKYDEFACAEILKNTFEIGFGKKKSSGYGQFEIVDYSVFESLNEAENSDSFLVLGNYLPSKKDSIIPIGYDINTKFGKFGEELSLSDNPFKNPIVFLTAGSCFKSTISKIIMEE